MERKQRAKMPTSQRAKQFMPFAAVKGLEKAILEQEQLLNKVEQVEVGEEKEQEINEKLNHLEKGDMVSVCFCSDGQYRTIQGSFKHFDLMRSAIVVSGITIPIKNIRVLVNIS